MGTIQTLSMYKKNITHIKVILFVEFFFTLKKLLEKLIFALKRCLKLYFRKYETLSTSRRMSAYWILKLAVGNYRLIRFVHWTIFVYTHLLWVWSTNTFSIGCNVHINIHSYRPNISSAMRDPLNESSSNCLSPVRYNIYSSKFICIEELSK